MNIFTHLLLWTTGESSASTYTFLMNQVRIHLFELASALRVFTEKWETCPSAPGMPGSMHSPLSGLLLCGQLWHRVMSQRKLLISCGSSTCRLCEPFWQNCNSSQEMSAHTPLTISVLDNCPIIVRNNTRILTLNCWSSAHFLQQCMKYFKCPERWMWNLY